jgi:hypothetical protein
LAQIPGVRLVSLQKGARRELLPDQRDRFPLVDFTDELDETAGPFRDTAAVMAHLDLVISADTAIGHLAGALGVPVWLLLPRVPDWRWLLGRDDSPWYPTMRLFRQRTMDDWPGVFEEVRTAIYERVT